MKHFTKNRKKAIDNYLEQEEIKKAGIAIKAISEYVEILKLQGLQVREIKKALKECVLVYAFKANGMR